MHNESGFCESKIAVLGKMPSVFHCAEKKVTIFTECLHCYLWEVDHLTSFLLHNHTINVYTREENDFPFLI